MTPDSTIEVSLRKWSRPEHLTSGLRPRSYPSFVAKIRRAFNSTDLAQDETGFRHCCTANHDDLIMMPKKHIQPGEKVPLKFTAVERRLALGAPQATGRFKFSEVRFTKGPPQIGGLISSIAIEPSRCSAATLRAPSVRRAAGRWNLVQATSTASIAPTPAKTSVGDSGTRSVGAGQGPGMPNAKSCLGTFPDRSRPRDSRQLFGHPGSKVAETVATLLLCYLRNSNRLFSAFDVNSHRKMPFL